MSHRTELERRMKSMSEAEVHTTLKFVQFLEDAEILQLPDVERLHALPRGDRPSVLDGAIEVPRAEWGTTLDGFSHLFHDLNCRLWVQSPGGDARILAEDVPLGQVYFDAKGSERNSVQVALNRSGTVYSDFRFMHRIADPRAIYLKDAEGGELADLIIESADQFTVLEVGIIEHPAPGIRRLAFLEPSEACRGFDR